MGNCGNDHTIGNEHMCTDKLGVTLIHGGWLNLASFSHDYDKAHKRACQTYNHPNARRQYPHSTQQHCRIARRQACCERIISTKRQANRSRHKKMGKANRDHLLWKMHLSSFQQRSTTKLYRVACKRKAGGSCTPDKSKRRFPVMVAPLTDTDPTLNAPTPYP